MIVRPVKTRIFKEGEDLFAFVGRYIKTLREKSVLVVTSKIVALSEKRTVIARDDAAKAAFIRRESDVAIPTKHVWLTIKDGMVMASAGIDESNANGKLILLPKDSFKTARKLRKRLRKTCRLKQLGILITDSRTMPLRAGVTGVAVGYAGFRGVRDYRGKRDIFGRKFKFSRTNIADSLATAAALTMGEGNEQQPLAIIEDAPVEFSRRVKRKELYISIKEDMYRPLFSEFPDLSLRKGDRNI